jgi:hypothetical protein
MTMKTLTAIQDQFIQRINAAHSRWSHRKGFEWQKDCIGGHYGRVYYGAQKEAHKQLSKYGFSIAQRMEIIKQAHDVAILERNAE